MEIDSNNKLRLMISSNNLLGWEETDAVRGEDSFMAFEEMLQLAVVKNVDVILLGGNFFHDHVPSDNTLQKCLFMLHRYPISPIGVD